MKKILFSLFIFFPAIFFCHTVDVRILSTMTVSSVNVSIHSGRYLLYLDGHQQVDSLTTKVFQMLVVNDSIEIRIPDDTLGRFKSFQIIALDDSSVFKIKPIKPFSGTRIYDHTLEITVVNGSLQCINTVDLEH